MLPHASVLPANGPADPERPPTPSQNLFLPQSCFLPAFSSFDGVYATVALSLWCAVGRIIIPWEESFCFSGQPVVKGADAYKTHLGERTQMQGTLLP